MTEEDISVELRHGDLTTAEQAVVTEGFDRHTRDLNAPAYAKERVCWVASDKQERVVGALTTDSLWDWIYVDELWVSPGIRGAGLGRQLMQAMEAFAMSEGLVGIWLWTQSWQAEEFYRSLGYCEFTRFDNFPRDHERIGLRKYLG